VVIYNFALTDWCENRASQCVAVMWDTFVTSKTVLFLSWIAYTVLSYTAAGKHLNASKDVCLEPMHDGH